MSAADLGGFLAEPGQVTDWRLVVLLDSAIDAGLLGALPGDVDAVATAAGTDTRATRIVLDALVPFDVVTRDVAGTYDLGPSAPDDETAAVLHQHAGVIARWSGVLGSRLAGEASQPWGARDPAGLARWLDSLAARSRQRAPVLVDACLDLVPDARTVLDLAGGHGEYGLEFSRRGLEVTMQDRPVVVDVARERGTLEAAGITLHGADLFEEVVEGPFDIVWLAGVAHTYGPDGIEAMYRQTRPVVGGALVISTFLRHDDAVTALFAVQMLSGGNGGDTHAEEDHRRWLAAAGFTSVERRSVTGSDRDLLVARPI